MDQAIDIYRSGFKPSAQLQAPYVMLGFNVCAAATDAEARLLRTSSLQAVVRLRQGSPGPLPPPMEDFEATLTPQDQYLISQFTSCSAVGSHATVAREIGAFIDRTGADELMIVSQIFDHPARLRSFETVAEIARTRAAAATATAANTG
jgi:alkanesulfonate monooxygenase SsuD/methylene tetrahydromethanopterin reductase-like flavin-dependent oxidoreductase (luciferase family)